MENADAIFRIVLHAAGDNPVLSGLTILVLFSLIQDFVLFRKLRRLLRGGDGKSLEGTIRGLQDRVALLETHAVKATAAFDNIDARLQKSIRGVSVKRFDPFQGGGGQQSFAAALVNESGDGAVISGIHARDGVRVYTKAVKGFSSERELSDEEKTAIADARESLKLEG